MINKDILKKIILISSISWVMVGGILIGLGIGYYLDKFFKTSPIFIIIFLIIGIIGGCYEAVRILMKAIK